MEADIDNEHLQYTSAAQGDLDAINLTNQPQPPVTITDDMGNDEQQLPEKNDDPGHPPPPHEDDNEGQMEDTPASPSEDNTCAGIENLCFLSNTVSRLKFDCVSSLQIMSALNLANLNLNDMSYLEYKSAIDSVPNYENIMDDEDELVQQIAYENSKNTNGNVEGDSTFDPVTGDSPNTIAARNTEIYGGYCLQADLLPLLQFTETVRNDAKNNCKLHKILSDMRDIMKCAFGIPEDEFHMNTQPPFSYIRLYDNIDLVELDTKSLFPKFSFNILSIKSDMLLQTRLLAGRENGMGFFLNDYVGSALQPYFDSIISSGFAKVKIIPPADTSHLWQIKLRVLKTDFIFISLQIINVKQEYFATFGRGSFMVDQIYNTISTLPTTYAVGADGMVDSINIEQRILEDYNKALNLCFSLYNKCLSKDFNALCSLSELDGIIAEMLIKGDPKSCKIFTTYIEYFLTNLVDTYINVKKQYFYLGLYNLLVSIIKTTPVYTPETKAYEMLFDSNISTKLGKNIFFDSMHIIKQAVNNANAPNAPCKPLKGDTSATKSVQKKMSEPIRFAMGGGKLYSLYQKALNSAKPITITFLCPDFIVLDPAKKLVQILHDFQNNTFIQQYLQSRDKENIQLREKINQFFLLKIQEQLASEIPNEFLSEMITILETELKSEKIFSYLNLNKKLTDLSSADPTDYASIILELSTVLPVLPIIDDINRPLYEDVTELFLKTFIPNLTIDSIKYLLLNFESIRCHYNNKLLLDSMYEPVNPAADADFGMFYEDTALGATSCMTTCMILQLALKDLIEKSVIISSPDNEPWSGSEIDIGNSCIGTPPVTLSSLRIVINNSFPFYENIISISNFNTEILCETIGELLTLIKPVNEQKPDIKPTIPLIKATISPFDFVQKGSLIGYIKHILEAVNTFGMLYTYERSKDNIKINITRITPDQIELIAQELSNYCMITVECCSTPLKGIFDIFYTLFIIENFANRALVTQKINKELKRVAICAKVLFLHYKELLDLYPSSPNIEIKNMLDILLEMCSFSFSQVPFSLNNESQMIYIMNKYVEFVNMIAKFALQSREFLFFCRLPDEIVTKRNSPSIKGYTQIENAFNKLLENSSMDNETKKYTYIVDPNSKVTSQLTKCIPCVLGVLNNCQPSILQMLNNNKQYCAECDAMNKASGRIILSSAYQSVLWSRDNYKTISKTRPRRDVSGLYDLLFPNKDLIQNDYFKDFIKVFIDNILEQCKFSYTDKDKKSIEVKIRDICNLDEIQGIAVNKPGVFIDPTTGNNTLQSFTIHLQILFWFLTSVFGVKTKSKSTKIQGLTRKYLSLIVESFPNPLVTNEQRNIITDLFGYNITIKNLQPPSASPSPTGSATGSPTCPKEIPPDYLCLAYNNLFARMAYDKYDDYAKKPPKTEDSAGANECHVVLYAGGIAIKPNTPVMDFILTDLSGRFEKLPAGISKIIAVSEKMRGVLLNFLSSYKNPNYLVSVQKYLCSLSEDSFADILYVPGSHDAKKFFELQPGERTLWLRHLIDKIRISKNVVDGGTGKPDPNDRFFCIKLLFLLIKYLILPEISFGTQCETILTVKPVESVKPVEPVEPGSVGLLNGLPPLTESDINFLTEKINSYYDKCGQIERQQKVNALNADRKGITLSAGCAVPKKKSDASKVSETFVDNFNSAIVAAKEKAREETEETEESVESSSTKRPRTSGKSASSKPEKSSLTPEQQATIDAAIKTEAADVVSQLLQNLLVPKQKRTKKSTKKKQDDVVNTTDSSAPKKQRADASTAASPSAPSPAPPVAFGLPLASQSFGVQVGTPFTFQPQLQSFGAPAQSATFGSPPTPLGASTFVAPAQLSPFGASQAQIGAPAQFASLTSQEPAPPPTSTFGASLASPSTPAAPAEVPELRVAPEPVIPPSELILPSLTSQESAPPTPPPSAAPAFSSAPELQQQQIRVSKKDGPTKKKTDNTLVVSGSVKRKEPDQPDQYNVNLRDVNIRGSKMQAIDQESRNKKKRERDPVNNSEPERDAVKRRTRGGGSPTLSIPTPSKTRKSHQRKRSQSSNKSTFKRRKYTAE